MTNSNTSAVKSVSQEKQINIRVDEKGYFYIDGKKKEIETLTSEFLEQIVDASLNDRVDYDINGEKPIATFFKTLKEGTSADSELRKVYLAANKDSDTEESTAGIEAEDDIDAENKEA